jgi:hypothetical protein
VTRRVTVPAMIRDSHCRRSPSEMIGSKKAVPQALSRPIARRRRGDSSIYRALPRSAYIRLPTSTNDLHRPRSCSRNGTEKISRGAQKTRLQKGGESGPTFCIAANAPFVPIPALSRCNKVRRQRACSAAYSITSSARASSEGGTVRPSAFAVLRLSTSSSFVGCWIGRSPGFAPLRMRPT